MLNQHIPLDRLFHALADQTRRDIVERLCDGPASVSTLAAPLAMTLPSVMQHLQVLGDSGLVRSEKLGRVRTYHIELDVLNSAGHWINARKTMWECRLDRLGDYLNEQESNPGSKT